MGKEREVWDDKIVLGLLEAFGSGEDRSQRHVARELGIALGLANAYIRRCVRIGLLKVSQIPAKRYAYYLTPEGFAEKSRLTAAYLASSFELFRTARAECSQVFAQAKRRGLETVCLVGASDIAEIAVLCSIEAGIRVHAIVDPSAHRQELIGIPVYRSFEEIHPAPTAAIVTSIHDGPNCYELAVTAVGDANVLVPKFLFMSKAERSAMPTDAGAQEIDV